MMTTNEINRLAKILKGYYMGTIIPDEIGLRGYYDREAWEGGNNPCTMYAESHSCIECVVEYQHDPKSYLGEDVLAAHCTHYVGDGKYFRVIEYWNAKDVELFV